MKFDVIVIDPPWPIKKIQRKTRPNQKEIDYSIMSIENIKAIPISLLTQDDCICFLWTIQKFLRLSFDILEEWRFRPLLTLTWDKENGMCLHGFHLRSEFVVVGYKGNLPLYRSGVAFPTVFEESSWRKHSIKPEIFYKYAETFGKSRLDIFARKNRLGWTCIGNEITGNDICKDLEILERR